MDATTLLAKTQKGFDELRTHRHALPPRLRALLTIVDGKHSVGQIADRLRTLTGVETGLAELVVLGFVEDLHALDDGAGGHLDLSAGTRFEIVDDLGRLQETKQFLNDTVRQLLGLRSTYFRHRIKRCAKLEELSMLVDEYQELVAEVRGGELASSLADRARRLMGR